MRKISDLATVGHGSVSSLVGKERLPALKKDKLRNECRMVGCDDRACWDDRHAPSTMVFRAN